MRRRFPLSARSSATTWCCSAARRTPSGAGQNPATRSGSRSQASTHPASRGRSPLAGEDSAAALPAGPYTVKISGHQTVELHNVLVGDVWLCGGQSNMQVPLRCARNGEEEVKAANYPEIRFFSVAPHSAYHHTDVRGGNVESGFARDGGSSFGGRVLLCAQGPAGDPRSDRSGGGRPRRNSGGGLDQRRRASPAEGFRRPAGGTRATDCGRRAGVRQLRHALVRPVRHRAQGKLGCAGFR